MPHAPRIAIVGAGPAGLTAALTARKLGLDVTVFEKAADFSRVAGGTLLHSNGLRVLEALGILDLCRPILRTTTTISVQQPDGTQLVCFDYGRSRLPQPCAAAVLRQELAEFMLSAAEWADVPVVFGRRCTGVSADTDGASLFFADGGEYPCDIVLACDGTHSRVCERGGLPGTTTAPGMAYLRGVSERASPDAVAREVCDRRGRRFVSYPLPGDRTAFMCSVPVGEWRRILASQLEFWIASWHTHGPEVVAQLNAVIAWDRVSYHEVHEVQLQHWSRGRVFALGDAAHAMRPQLDQGANAAMVDALVLIQLLAAALGDGTSLATVGRCYERLRRPFVTRTQRAAQQLDVAQWSVAQRLMRRILPLSPAERRLRAGYHRRERHYFCLPAAD